MERVGGLAAADTARLKVCRKIVEPAESRRANISLAKPQLNSPRSSRGAVACEEKGRSAADPSAATGNDRYLAREVEIITALRHPKLAPSCRSYLLHFHDARRLPGAFVPAESVFDYCRFFFHVFHSFLISCAQIRWLGVDCHFYDFAGELVVALLVVI
jgi:hypothetical protein